MSLPHGRLASRKALYVKHEVMKSFSAFCSSSSSNVDRRQRGLSTGVVDGNHRLHLGVPDAPDDARHGARARQRTVLPVQVRIRVAASLGTGGYGTSLCHFRALIEASAEDGTRATCILFAFHGSICFFLFFCLALIVYGLAFVPRLLQHCSSRHVVNLAFVNHPELLFNKNCSDGG